jgi:phosphoribosylformylglycinamidine (FGAM) synthase PurS component
MEESKSEGESTLQRIQNRLVALAEEAKASREILMLCYSLLLNSLIHVSVV